MYIHNKQIIAVNAIDENSVSFKQVLDAVKVYVNTSSTPAAESPKDEAAVRRRPYYNQAVISKVLTIGSKRDDTPFPKGFYSSKISMKKYNYMYFHVSLKRPINQKRKVYYKLHIFDDIGNRISDLSSEIECEPYHDTFSKGLILRGTDGTALPAGKYYAEISLDDSLPVRHTFLLID